MFTLLKVEEVIRLLDDARNQKFPHPDSSDAVNQLRDHLVTIKDSLLAEAPSFSKLTVQNANNSIAPTLMALGLIANSSNVRNALELHQPILDLCKQVLTVDLKLILTFEWEYEPFTYSHQTFSFLKGFVFIGLPASEAENALILPVTGHEIGHSLWSHEKLAAHYELKVAEAFEDLLRRRPAYETIIRQSKDPSPDSDLPMAQEPNARVAIKAAVRQIEEVFCDLIAVALFGYSYLRVFQYFLSTTANAERDSFYPSVIDRAVYLSDFAKDLNIGIPHGFQSCFSPEAPPELDSIGIALLDISDQLRQTLSESIFSDVTHFIKTRHIRVPLEEDAYAVIEAFKSYVPSEEVKEVSTILNGAWLLLDTNCSDANFLPDAKDEYERVGSLNELILKSIEMLEISRKRDSYAEAK